MSPAWLFFALELLGSVVVLSPVVRGTLEGSRVYTVGVTWSSDREARASGGGLLVILRQDIRGEKGPVALKCGKSVGGNWSALFRWQLIDKNCYFVTYGNTAGGIGPDDAVIRERGAVIAFSLPMLEAVWVEGLTEPDRQRRYREFNYSGHSWNDFGTLRYRTHGESDDVKQQIYLDIWSRGEKFWEVYAAEPHRGNRLTREDFRPEKVKRDNTNWIDVWETVGTWTFDWTGPFHVAANLEDRYFVTDIRTRPKPILLGRGGLPPKDDDPALVFGSRIFLAPRAAKPDTPLKEVWKGRRIEALIHDNETQTFFAFTKDEYFEIANPIRPKPHNIAVHRSNSADRALEVAARCGRVIRGIPEPKKKP